MMRRIYPDELYHYGVLGMKWGVRRYQNPDGTRTALGKMRERVGGALSSVKEKAKKANTKEAKSKRREKAGDAAAVAGGLFLSRMAGKAEFEEDNKKLGKVRRASQNYENALKTVGEKKSKKKRYSERENYRKQARAFSDRELQDRVRRLNLEKQYVDLSSYRDDDGSWSRAEKVAFGREVTQTILPFIAPVAISAAKKYIFHK